jgi:hypothetical protein
MTKTIHTRFNHEVGEMVEGCKILEKSILSPPDPVERRRGIYDYLVEVPPTMVAPRRPSRREPAPNRDSFTRCTPDEHGSRLTRRIPSR